MVSKHFRLIYFGPIPRIAAAHGACSGAMVARQCATRVILLTPILNLPRGTHIFRSLSTVEAN